MQGPRFPVRAYLSGALLLAGCGLAACSENGASPASAGEAGAPPTAGPGGSSAQGGQVAGAGAPNNGGAFSPAEPGMAGAEPGAAGQPPALEPWVPSFQTRTLDTTFVAEGAAIGDIDDDGHVDVWAGPRWYIGPGLDLGGKIYEADVLPIEGIANHFSSFLDDMDSDGDLDGVCFGRAGTHVAWYENPGPAGLDQLWTRHVMVPNGVGNEAPTYTDLVGDEQAELVFLSNGVLGYAVRGATATDTWTFKAISPDLGWPKAVHGLGVGDVDGDGFNDVVDRGNVWLQRPQPGADPDWERHEVDFAAGGRGGAQMLIYDVDGDDDADIVTSLDAHQYGIAWFEQTTPSTFVRHDILPNQAADGNFSQPHALGVADMNGDGLLDFVTGKRYYAHAPPQDPGTFDPAVIHWFELSRGAAGPAFTLHLVHDDSGVGANVAIADINADQKPDIAVINKKGTFVHIQQ